MNMFCFQCQEAAKNVGCTTKGACGKEDVTANHMDVLVYNLKGLAWLAARKAEADESIADEAGFITRGLFATITNANFDTDRITALTFEAIERKQSSCPRTGPERTSRRP